VTTDPQAAERLAARTLALVDIPSVSRHEERIAEYLEAAVPRDAFHEWHADGEAFLYRTPHRLGRPLVLLAGHLDTVPPQDNLPGRIEDGHVVGLGASDMKGGLAVMIELAHWIEEARPELAVDLGLLFFTREELPVAESPLPNVFAAVPVLRDADLAIVMEPTDNTVQAGCLGNLNATLRFDGVSAHSARPWTGDNAIARALEGLREIVAIPPRPVEIDGLVFTEVLSVTGISGGVADNVIPDRVDCRLNFRFAPGRDVHDAERRVRELVGEAGTLEVTSVSASGAVAAHAPLVERLRAAGPFEVLPKQAWTPVAQFTHEGVDAVNLGPGATAYAHTRDERIAVDEMVRTYTALQRFLTADPA
jgi:succinyl-diaminopimelate desuccinylase